MGYRDEHDAALARADALPREIEAARASEVRKDERLAWLERELASARRPAPEMTRRVVAHARATNVAMSIPTVLTILPLLLHQAWLWALPVIGYLFAISAMMMTAPKCPCCQGAIGTVYERRQVKNFGRCPHCEAQLD